MEQLHDQELSTRTRKKPRQNQVRTSSEPGQEPVQSQWFITDSGLLLTGPASSRGLVMIPVKII